MTPDIPDARMMAEARARVGARLRQAREILGLRAEVVCRAMEWSSSRLARVEAGTIGVSVVDMRRLAGFYTRVDEMSLRELFKLIYELARAEAKGNRHWTDKHHHDWLPPLYLAYLEAEARATRIRYYEPVLLPPICQRGGYAEAVIDAVPEWPTEQKALRVDMLRARQDAVLNRRNPPVIEAVIDQSVLLRQIAGPNVMRNQMEHLTDFAHRRNVTLAVIEPASMAGQETYPGPAHSFTVLEYASEPPEVYLDILPDFTRLLTDPSQVATYRLLFDVMLSVGQRYV